ncbi:ABC-F family ATP-binding cassette domain-containing protein [Candidatus Uhrbacteria bacterium]|nr:ABC-F family ATP-binding cassette domain-containing protein [Candidatus Uhrbacteria bacterium]
MSISLLAVQNLKKAYGSRNLLNGVTFNINNGEHIGLIGRNGAGKSTIIRIISGIEECDSGEVTYMPQLRLGYLEQHEDFLSEDTVMSYLKRKSDKPDWMCAKMAGTFQLKKEILEKRILTLSGGYRMRVKLSALLLQDPNLLLLDEPTNYLDLQTVLLLEHFLASFHGSFIIISHDREFLKNTCKITLEIERGTIERYEGDVEEWLSYKEERRIEIERHNKNIESQRKHMQEFVDRFRAKASKATQAQDRLKRLAKLEKIDIKQPLKTARIHIPQSNTRKGTVLRLQNLAIGYNEHTIAEHIEMEFNRGDHVAVLGENGQGKSTLLKTLSGRIPLLHGHVRWAHKLNIAEYAQHVHEALDGTETVGNYLSRHGDGLLQEDVLRMAGNFLFSIEDLDKTCHMLSGGEKARLCLAGILLQKPDVLLLDEPSNHLDMETVEALGQALTEWHGTLFFVSHSRTFVNLLASSIIDINNGNVYRYPGNYEEYVWELKRKLELYPSSEEVHNQYRSLEASPKKSARAERYEELKRKRQQATKLEKQLTELGIEKRKLMDEVIANPNDFSVERNRRLSTIDTIIHHTEDEWLKLQDAMWKSELE